MSVIISRDTPPSMADMNELRDGDTIVAPLAGGKPGDRLAVYVRATYVKLMEVGFLCPFCWTMFKTNGKPAMNALHITHQHGNDGNTSVRFVGHRVDHCYNNKFPDDYNGFYIVVAPSTHGATS